MPVSLSRKPTFIGSAYVQSAPWGTTSTVLAAFPAGTSSSPVVELNPGPGVISTVASAQPKITINGLPSGTYRVTINILASVSGANGSYAISDGSTLSGFIGCDCVNRSPGTLVGYFKYAAKGDRSFEVFGANDNGGQVTQLYTLPIPGWKIGFFVERVGN